MTSRTTISKDCLTEVEKDYLLDFVCELINRADDYKPESNAEYLEKNVGFLESEVIKVAASSVDRSLGPHQRAYFRDKHQGCLGLINGLKFSLSFLFHKDVDLKAVAGQLQEEQSAGK